MIDLKHLREQPSLYQDAAKAKRVAVDIPQILKLDADHRALVNSINELRSQLKAKSKVKPSAGEIEHLKALGDRLQGLDEQRKTLQPKLAELLAKIPNLPSDDTPRGDDETGNTVLREVGNKPKFDFAPREHWQLGEALGLLNIKRAGEVSGSRFFYLQGDLVLLQFALLQYALGILTNAERLSGIISVSKLSVPNKPFVPVITPVFIRPEVLQRMARLEPREERYYIPSDDLYLVGSAEHTLGPLHMDETLPEEVLPIRYVGYSTAFRREAGSYGKDTKGMIRVHQFDKLEMESFTVSEQSTPEQDFLVAIQEHLLQSLGLPYRVVQVCTGEMGGPDARQIDLETWMSGQGRYRETHTADLMTDYQARRLRTRVRRSNGVTELAHMNDATAFAIGRTLVAIMENYQQTDGTIAVPDVLRPYVGKAVIGT